jgi:hypothetical protein
MEEMGRTGRMGGMVVFLVNWGIGEVRSFGGCAAVETIAVQWLPTSLMMRECRAW